MSFITNISTTPITGVYDEGGKPSGINEVGTTTSKFSSVTTATTNLVPSSYASGTESSTSYPFSNSGLPEYEPQATTGNDTSSNSANSLQPFAQGTVAPQINTSIRNGNWDYYNGWNTDPSASVESGLLAIDVDIDVTSRGSNSVGADKSTRSETVTYFVGSPQQQTLHNGGAVENCEDCPQTLDDETCNYPALYLACTGVTTPLDAPSKPDWTRRAVFTGILPRGYGSGYDTGLFFLDQYDCKISDDISLYFDLTSGPITPVVESGLDTLLDQIGRNCTFFINQSNLKYAGPGFAETSNDTELCNNDNVYNGILYETDHDCKNSPYYDLMNVDAYGIYGLDFVRYEMTPTTCECLTRKNDGFGRRGSVAGHWRAGADAVVARADSCVTTFKEIDPNQCTVSSKIYTAWPTGLIPSSGSIADGTVTSYANPYWKESECDFIVGVREIQESGSDAGGDCPSNYIAVGDVIEMPVKRLVVSSDTQFVHATNLTTRSPASTGTESFCGETIWMWGGSEWHVSNTGEGCGSTGDPPSQDGAYNGDVATTQCPCP